MSDLDRRIRLARLVVERLGPLFPLQRRGKEPLRKTRGCLDATDDVDRVDDWIRRGLNVGLHTVRVFVLDVDLRSGGDRTLAALEAEHGKLPDTPRQFTGGGGGEHHFFALVEGVRWRAKLGAGLDIKAGPGCYVVVPPSAVSRPYTWDESPEHTELAEIPEWLLERAVRLDPPADVAATGPVAESVIGIAFRLAGRVREQRGEKLLVRCPFEATHSRERERRQDSSTVVFAPSSSSPLGHFHCSHAHCVGLRAEDALATLDESIVLRAVAAAHEAAERRRLEEADPERAAIQAEGCAA